MPPKVFLIDDEECIRDSIKWFLDDLGYDVVVANMPENCDVFHGHDCTKENPCGHALIIDHNMPSTNGIDFIEQLIKRGCKGMVSNMLVISGDIRQVDIDKATRIGCTVMQKPVSFKTLVAWLMNLQIIPPNS